MREKKNPASELSEELGVNVVMYQGSVLLPFIFAVAVDLMTKLTRIGDLFLMSETIGGFRNKFKTWREAFESIGLKVSVGNGM